MTALAHQFAGLISPLHGSFSADRAMMPDNEISPVMLGPKRAISGPIEPPRSDRVIADSWRGLYGSDPFSSIWRPVAIEAFSWRFEIANSSENIGIRGVFNRRIWRHG